MWHVYNGLHGHPVKGKVCTSASLLEDGQVFASLIFPSLKRVLVDIFEHVCQVPDCAGFRTDGCDFILYSEEPFPPPVDLTLTPAPL